MKAGVSSSDPFVSSIDELQKIKASLWSSLCEMLWENLLGILGQGETIRVEKKRDRHGNWYWQIHDLWRDETISFGSETEVRRWLEQRYSR